MTPPRSVLTIGTFDGVHVGHAALLSRARHHASRHGATVVAMAFDPHPLTLLRPDHAPARLTTFVQRERLLRAAGADRVVRLEPTAEFLALSAEDFLEQVCREWKPAAFVEGPDFRFGRARKGDIDLLTARGRREGFDVDVVDPVTISLSDHTVAPASSTLARWLISHGRVADAAIVLGHPHELEGIVIPGDRRGREIGFPTANLRTECLPPADGVYAAEAILADGRAFAAALSVGTKPTFGLADRTVEAYLLDARAEGATLAGLPEYGWSLRLRVRAWVREQVKFHSIDALVEQMHRDCLRVRALTPHPSASPELKIAIHASLETPACP